MHARTINASTTLETSFPRITPELRIVPLPQWLAKILIKASTIWLYRFQLYAPNPVSPLFVPLSSPVFFFHSTRNPAPVTGFPSALTLSSPCQCPLEFQFGPKRPYCFVVSRDLWSSAGNKMIPFRPVPFRPQPGRRGVTQRVDKRDRDFQSPRNREPFLRHGGGKEVNAPYGFITHSARRGTSKYFHLANQGRGEFFFAHWCLFLVLRQAGPQWLSLSSEYRYFGTFCRWRFFSVLIPFARPRQLQNSN